MINFNQIPMLTIDALMPLLLEDNAVPPVVDMTGYHGPRSLAEVTAMTAQASEISELNRIALAIGWGKVEVVRSSVNSRLISPQDHPCLEQVSCWLMSVKGPGDVGANYAQHLQSAFLLEIAARLSGQTLWSHGATYFALGLQADASLIVPDMFCPSPDFLAAVDDLDGSEYDWSGLGVSITPSDALAFMQTLAKYNPSAEAVGTAIQMVFTWLHYLNGAITSGKALLQEFEAVRPDRGFLPSAPFGRSPRRFTA